MLYVSVFVSTLINIFSTSLFFYRYKLVNQLKSVRWPLQQSSCLVPHPWMIFVTLACSCPSVSILRVSALAPPPLVMRKVRSLYFHQLSPLFFVQTTIAKG